MKEFTQKITVQDSQTAEKLGSGGLPVYSTPSMIALMENTAVHVLSNLPDGESSVGTMINIQHLRATAVGETVSCTARLIETEGRRYLFEVEAYDSENNLIGKGTHERFAVNIERFMGKLKK